MDQPKSEPGGESGAGSGVMSGVQSGAGLGAESELSRNPVPGDQPGVESGFEPGLNRSFEPGVQSGAQPSIGLGAESTVEPGNNSNINGAQVWSTNEGKSGRPKHHRKHKRLIIGIFMAVILIGVIVTIIIKAPWSPFGRIGRCNNKPATNAPRDIMACYLNDKYGKDFVLTGKIRRTPFGSSALWEHYYESDAHPVDDPRLRFKVKLDGDNKEHKFEKSDTYIEEGQILAEEDRLRPHVERIFGKNTEIGVKYKLCDRGEDSMKGSHDLPKAMDICKQETADMTKEEIIDSSLYNDSGLSHRYTVYIYARDRQSIKTTDDKTKIIKGLKELVKYLPDINPDLLSLYYFIRGDKSSDEGSELALSAKDLSDQGIRSLVHDFNSNLATVGPAARSGITYWEITMPGKKGWLKLDDDE